MTDKVLKRKDSRQGSMACCDGVLLTAQDRLRLASDFRLCLQHCLRLKSGEFIGLAWNL